MRHAPRCKPHPIPPRLPHQQSPRNPRQHRDPRRPVQGPKRTLRHLTPRQNLRATNPPLTRNLSHMPIHTCPRHIQPMNRINPHRIIQQNHPTPARHIEDLGHVRKIARGAYHLGGYLAFLELPHERGFRPSDPRRAMLGTQRMDIAEIIHPVAARGV